MTMAILTRVSRFDAKRGHLRTGLLRVLAGCILALCLSGCAYYDITLTNGDVIRSKGKPKKDEQGLYRFKDLAGQETTINPMRVRQIEPVRRGSPPSRPF